MTLLYKARSQSVHELNACVQDRARSGDANMYEHGSGEADEKCEYMLWIARAHSAEQSAGHYMRGDACNVSM